MYESPTTSVTKKKLNAFIFLEDTFINTLLLDTQEKPEEFSIQRRALIKTQLPGRFSMSTVLDQREYVAILKKLSFAKTEGFLE